MLLLDEFDYYSQRTRTVQGFDTGIDRSKLDEDLDASEAGYRVGYDDAWYFSREYKRYFGEPPIRDVERLRGLAAA